VTADVDLWLFLPHAVGVDENDYGRDDFYQDLRAYTRLATPKLSLAALTEAQNPLSPLHQLDTYAGSLGAGKPPRPLRKAIRRECRLLGCTFRVATRTPLDALRSAMTSLDTDRSAQLATTFANQCHAILNNYRQLAQRYQDRTLGKRTRRCMGFTDEYLSLQAEEGVAAAIEEVDKYLSSGEGKDGQPQESALTEARRELAALAKSEQAYRAVRGWRTVLAEQKDDSADAGYVDQAGLLKKYIASALFLRLENSRTQAWAEHAALGFAAALAMAWAVGVQLAAFFLLGMELNQSMSAGLMVAFATIAVAAYIMKDRIKASVAGALQSRLPTWLPDRTQRIFLPDEDTPIGTISERMEFVDQEHVPPEILKTRLATARSHLVAESQPDILHYHRDVKFDARGAAKAFPRFDGVKDVLRLNVWRWLRTLASHRKRMMWLDDDGVLKERNVPHEYVVDLIVRYTHRSGRDLSGSAIGKARVWMDRRGILRVQLVEG
jgi:hypothetical protein